VTKILLSRASPCFGRYVKPLVPIAFTAVSTYQSALGPRGGLPFFLCMIHKEDLCPSRGGDINDDDVIYDLIPNKKISPITISSEVLVSR
jgi:hypothetical protein